MTTEEATGSAGAQLPDSADGRESSIARKVAIGAAGGVITTAGLVMLVTPGPGILVSLAGLGILGSEFPAARRVLDRIKSGRRTDESQ